MKIDSSNNSSVLDPQGRHMSGIHMQSDKCAVMFQYIRAFITLQRHLKFTFTTNGNNKVLSLSAPCRRCITMLDKRGQATETATSIIQVWAAMQAV